MADSYFDSITQLKLSPSLTTQIASARHIKNGLIGHPDHKEIFVRNGLIDSIAAVLATSVRGTDDAEEYSGKPLSEEDELRLQVILLLDSLVSGGPAFVPPVISSLVLTHIESILSPIECPPKLVLAVLRLLVHLAESSPYTSPDAESFQQSAALETLYTKATIQIFSSILGQSTQSTTTQEQISLVCSFVSKTCITDQQQALLTAGGVSDLLAARVASYHVHQQRGWPTRPQATLVSGFLPPPTCQTLSNILAALEAVMTGSHHRTARFINSPLINLVFPQHKPEAFHDRSSTRKLVNPSSVFVSPLEVSLPQIPPQYMKESSTFGKIFPSLGSVAASKTENMSFDFLQVSDTTPPSENDLRHTGDESSFIPWLIHLFRTESGICRLRACKLLACLRRAGWTSKSRDRMLALLVVPVLISTLEDAMKTISPGHQHGASVSTDTIRYHQTVKEEVPFILASFLAGNQLLQKAASESNIISKACQLLKNSFESISLPPSGWSSTTDSTADTAMGDDESPITRRLGLSGLPSELVHALRCREGALKLFAALADRDDRYRKQLLADSTIATCLKDSLMPWDAKAYASLDPLKAEKLMPQAIGNTIPVLLVACEAVRMFARSVTLLRTNLLDAHMAEPLIKLLNYSNVDVVRQATDACVNIANDFCPMREELVKEDTMQILCDHAHSADSNIRLVSLLALKNLCNKPPQRDKLKCFSLLGSGWLVQVIRGASSLYNEASRSSKPVSTLSMGGNAAGESVDILNAMEADPMDIIDDRPLDPATSTTSPHTQEFTLPDSITSIILPSTSTSYNPTTLTTDYTTTLTKLSAFARSLAASESYAEDLRLQTAGLDLLRNLLLDDDKHILDVVFAQIGTTPLFDLLLSKLKTSSYLGSSSAVPLGPSARAPSPYPVCTAIESDAVRALTTSVLFVLVHIAAGASVHRQLLIAQRPIILAMFPLLSHSDPEIRKCVLWVVINLTYVDDKDDAVSTRARAQELRAMGWEERLKEVKENDEAQDVRDRAATAVEQLSGQGVGNANGGNGGSGNGSVGERDREREGRHGGGSGGGGYEGGHARSYSGSMMHSSSR